MGLFKGLDRLREEYGDTIDPSVRKNLELVCEIRDNAVHFFNKGIDISRAVQELGTACLRNYVVLVRQWFAIDMTEYNFFLMPLAFVTQEAVIQAISLNADERKLIQYLRIQSQIKPDDDANAGDFNVSLAMEFKFAKSKSDDAIKVKISTDADAMPVKLSEEDIREKYPWDYNILTTRLDKRYSDFKQNKNYHDIRKMLENDEKYCNERYLDPLKKKGIVKRFYNPNIMKEFDLYYTKRKA